MAFSNKEIETRVVEMEFDNKQFEKGAEQTLSTLDKLKKSLNFKNADSGLDTLQKSINRVSFKGLTDQVGSIESAFTTLAGRIKINFFDQIANYTLNAAKQLERTTIGQIISGGKSRAMNIATAKFKMEGMGVTWDEIYKDLDYAVAGTAYGLDAAANIGSQLVASGVQVGTDMATALRAVSGVAAMTSSSYEEIGNVFAAVAGQGKVMAMQLNQLSLRGINAAATLAKYMGVTEAEVRDLVSKGQVDFNTFAMAMDSAFGEHAKEANKTFTGAMSNVRAALSKLGQMFYSPFYDAMIAPLNTIRETINDVKAALTDTKDGTVVSFEQRLAELVKLGGETLDLLIKIARIGVQEVVQNVDKLNAKMDGIINAMKSVKKWMEKAIPDNASTKLEAVADAIDTITEAEQKAAWDIWNKGLYGNGEERIKNLEAEGLNASRVQKYIDALIAANFDEKKAQEALGMAIASTSSKVEAQSDAYDGLSNGAKVIINLMQTFGTVFKNAVRIIGSAKNAFHDIFPSTKEGSILVYLSEGLLKFVQRISLTETDLENLRKTFGGFLSLLRLVYDVFSSIVKAFKGATSTLTGGNSFVLELTGNIGELITEFVKMVESGNHISNFISFMQGKVEGLIDRIGALIGLEPDKWFDRLRQKGKDVADYFDSHSFKEGIEYVTNGIKEFFALIFKDSGNKASVFDTIKTKVSSVGKYLSGAIKILKDFWDSAVKFIKNITYIFTGKWDKLAEQGKGGLAEHFKGFSDAVDETVTTFIETINRLISNVNTVDTEGITKASTNLSSAGGSLAGLMSNLKGDVHVTKQDVQDTLVDVKALVAIFTTFISGLSFYKLTDGIQAMGNGFQNVTESLTTVARQASKAIKRLSKSMAFKAIAEGIKAIGLALLEVVLAIGALTLIAHFDKEGNWKDATLAIAGIMAEMVVLTIFASKLAGFGGTLAILALAGLMTSFAAACGTLMAALMAVENNAELEARLNIVAKVIGKMAAALVCVTAVIAIIYKIASKATRSVTTKYTKDQKGKHLYSMSQEKEVMSDTPLGGLALTILSLAGSLLLMTAVMAIIGHMKPDTIDQGLSVMMAMMTVLTASLAIIFVAAGAIKGDTHKALDGMNKLLKTIAKDILVMGFSIALLSSVFALLLTSSVGTEAITKALTSIIVMFVLVGGLFAEMIFLTDKFKVGQKKLNALTAMINSISMFIGVVMGTLALVMGAIRIGGTGAWADAYGSMLTIFIGLGALMGIMINQANKIEVNEGNEVSDKYFVMIRMLKTFAMCVVAISAAMAVMSLVGRIAGWQHMLLSIGGILGIFLVVWKVMRKGIEGTKWGANKTDKIYDNISKAFLRISLSLVAIAAAVAVLIAAIRMSKLTLGGTIAVLVGFIGGVALVFGAVALMATKMNKLEVTNLEKVSKAFLIVAAGISVLALGLGAMMALAGKASVDLPGTIAMLAALMVVIEAGIGLITKFTDSTDVFQTGLSMAVVIAAFAGSMITIGAALKAVAEMNIGTDIIKAMKDLMIVLTIFATIPILLSTFKGFGKLKAIVSTISVLLSMGGVAVFFMMLAEVDWKSLEYGLTVLENHAASINMLVILAAGIAAIGALGGVKVAAGIAAAAVAIGLLAAAIWLLVAALGALMDLFGEKPVSVSDVVPSGADMSNAGEENMEQYVAGTERATGDARSRMSRAYGSVAQAGVDAVNETLDEHSPSRVAEQQAEMYGAGLINGITSSKLTVYNASQTLGEAIIDGFADSMISADPSQYVRTLGDDFATTYGNSLQAGFESAQDSVREGFGDFTFDYSEAFDDAPISPTITPVIDAEELDNQVQAVRQDEALGLAPVIDMSGIESIPLDTSSLSADMGTLFNGTDGEGGLLGSLKDMFTGEDGIFGTKKMNELKTSFNETLDKNGFSELLDGDGGIASIISALPGNIGNTVGKNIGDKMENFFGENSNLLSKIGVLGSGLGSIYNDIEQIKGLLEIKDTYNNTFEQEWAEAYEALSSYLGYRPEQVAGASSYRSGYGEAPTFRDRNGNYYSYNFDSASYGFGPY